VNDKLAGTPPDDYVNSRLENQRMFGLDTLCHICAHDRHTGTCHQVLGYLTGKVCDCPAPLFACPQPTELQDAIARVRHKIARTHYVNPQDAKDALLVCKAAERAEKALCEVKRLEDFPIENGWHVEGRAIYTNKTHDGPLIRDSVAHPNTLAMIADALNWRIKKQKLYNIVDAALVPASQRSEPTRAEIEAEMCQPFCEKHSPRGITCACDIDAPAEPTGTPAPCPLPAKWREANADLLERAGAIDDSDLSPENYAAYWTREACLSNLNVWLATRAQQQECHIPNCGCTYHGLATRAQPNGGLSEEQRGELMCAIGLVYCPHIEGPPCSECAEFCRRILASILNTATLSELRKP
jgi:hypothetical protein